MKKISTSRGLDILVDDCDYEFLNQFSWRAKRERNTYYAIRRVRINGRLKEIRMHRLIMDTPAHLQVDHRDRNGLNNQRNNLRNVRASDNCQNVAPRSNTGYLGVSRREWVNDDGSVSVRFTAGIQRDHVNYRLGNKHLTAEAAAMAYNAKAIELYGEKANLNEI